MSIGFYDIILSFFSLDKSLGICIVNKFLGGNVFVLWVIFEE